MKKKKKFILIISVLVILGIDIIFYFMNTNKDKIIFNNKYDEIEFGTKISYKDMIEKTVPKDLKINYPGIEVKEVGNYELGFSYKDGKDIKEQIHKFKIVDTKEPIIKLKINKVPVEVAINSNYNPTANIQSIENFSQEAIANQKNVDKKTYDKIKKQIKKTRDKLNMRIIKNEKDIKSYSVEKNVVYYVSNLNLQKEGKYSIKIMAVDENYNITEKDWELKVVPGGSILNSGGSVSCNYIGKDNGSTDAYDSAIKENYSYSEHKLVTRYELLTSIVFKSEYNTDENKSTLVEAFNNKYSTFANEKGVSVSIESVNEDSIITKIIVDFNLYDKKKDPLDVLVNKNGSEVMMEKIIKDANKNEMVCTIQ